MKIKAVTCPFIIAASLLPSFFTNSIYGYLPFLFALFLSALSLLYALLLRKFFHFLNIADTYSCERDKELDFTIHISNKSVLIFPRVEAEFYISDIYGKDCYTQTVEYILAPFEEKDFSLTMKFDHIGSYKAGLKRIKIYGLMGVKSFPITSGKEFHITVTPKILNYTDTALSDKISMQSDASLTIARKSGMEYTGIREYAAGDPIKNIHWNLSAHTSQYMTKKYEKHSAHAISILLDLQAPEYPVEVLMQIFDCIVEAALSIAHHAKKMGHHYEILYHKDGFMKRYAPQHFYELKDFIDDLPNITPDRSKYDINKFFEEQCSQKGNSARSIIICSSNLNRNMINMLIALKSSRKDPFLYYTIPVSLEYKEEQEGLQRLSILEEYNIRYKVIHSSIDLLKAG